MLPLSLLLFKSWLLFQLGALLRSVNIRLSPPPLRTWAVSRCIFVFNKHDHYV
jgi:hypothetical protein